MRRLPAAIVAAIIALVASWQAALAGDLTERELRAELVGKQIAWWEEGGWLAGHLFLLPDGRAEITVSHPRADGDTGRWTIRGGEICTEWTGLRSGRQKCYGVSRGAAGRFVTSGGNVFEVREAGV